MSAAWELWRVTMNTASMDSSASTASASVPIVVKPNFRWALTAESEPRVATRDELDVGPARQMGEQHRIGVVPGADEPDPQRPRDHHLGAHRGAAPPAPP